MRIGHAVRMGAVVFVVVGALGLAGEAAAAGPQWLPGQTIDPTQNPINSVSCPKALTCLALTDVAVVVQDNALSYERSPDSSVMNAVSCAPTTRFCMFVDDNGGAFTYNNGTFSAVATPDLGVSLDGVSCPISGFCMAIDHNNEVFKYSGGAWDTGTPLPISGGDSATGSVNVSCATNTSCVALVATDGGEHYYTWDGNTNMWTEASSKFDPSASQVVSLTCTSISFCLATDNIAQTAVFDGSTWSAPQPVSATNSPTLLYSSCAGTNCVALDFNDNAYSSSNGLTWTPGGNIHAGTLVSGITAVACATATLCVAGDGLGDATTYAVPPATGHPTLTGTPTVGQKLTLTHAHVQTTPVWFADDWRRCGGPDSSCSFNPISRSPSGYILTATDTGKYLDVRETIGFGFDEEGPVRSNIVGPIAPRPGTAALAGKVTTTRTGVVTVPLRCTGGPCRGTVKLTYRGATIGSAAYSIASGVTAKVKITLNTAGKNQLKQHNGQLPVKLVVTPTRGRAVTYSITLRD